MTVWLIGFTLWKDPLWWVANSHYTGFSEEAWATLYEESAPYQWITLVIPAIGLISLREKWFEAFYYFSFSVSNKGKILKVPSEICWQWGMGEGVYSLYLKALFVTNVRQWPVYHQLYTVWWDQFSICFLLKIRFKMFSSLPGPAIIRSDQRIREGEWTTIMAERNQRDGSLSVNGGVAVKGTDTSIATVTKLHIPIVLCT